MGRWRVPIKIGNAGYLMECRGDVGTPRRSRVSSPPGWLRRKSGAGPPLNSAGQPGACRGDVGTPRRSRVSSPPGWLRRKSGAGPPLNSAGQPGACRGDVGTPRRSRVSSPPGWLRRKSGAGQKRGPTIDGNAGLLEECSAIRVFLPMVNIVGVSGRTCAANR